MNKDIYIGNTSIKLGNSVYINQPKEIIDYIKIQLKEIDKLNNIIDELEEIINYEIQEWKDTDDELMKARVQEDKHILEVIEELKENKRV